ncbi:hypothetical protein Aperf_G00000008559 [Anoplocephala perfoliata]
MGKRKCKRDKEMHFKEKLPEDRFEDFTNATPWEKFITSLQIILLDWQRLPANRPSTSGSVSLIRSSIATFESFEFKVEHFIVDPLPITKHLDFESTRVLIVSSSYDLKEFILISPADPVARRLVGTTRIRLLLSSIEMALAASNCELPMLVSYGNDKLYHGLHLTRQGFSEVLPSSSNLVPDSGLKKIEYAMGPTELPYAETHLAKLRDIFLEKVGSSEKALNISVIQYFRMVNLKLTGQSFSHLDNPVEFVYSPERLLFQIALHLQLNLFATSINLLSEVINDDRDFRLVKVSPNDWSADCVIVDIKLSLIDDVYDSLRKACDFNSSKLDPEDLDPFMKSILEGELVATFSQEPPKLSQTSRTYSRQTSDEDLNDVLNCRYTGTSIRVLLVALHIITLRLSSAAFSRVVFGAWLTFLKYLQGTSNVELTTTHLVNEDSSPYPDSPIDQALFVISQHHALATHESSKPDKDDEFFDAVEEQALHHSGNTPKNCPVCHLAFEELENIPIVEVAKWISPYLIAHHLRLFRHFVVPPALATWYGARLRNLHEEVSRYPSDYETLFQLAKDFHRRSLCAISLNTFFKFCGRNNDFEPVVPKLAERLHSWSTYQVSRSLKVEHFNISKMMALQLNPQTRSMIAESLINAFSDPPGEGITVPISLSADSAGQSRSELNIQGASQEFFPAYRLVTITARHGARRPNSTLSGRTPQRLFVCIQYPQTDEGQEGSTWLQEKLEFIRNGQSESLHLKSNCGNREATCLILFAGCFGEDLDIR